MTQLSDEVVERVARAISLARDGFTESPPMPVTEYDYDLARAAIEAYQAYEAKGEAPPNVG